MRYIAQKRIALGLFSSISIIFAQNVLINSCIYNIKIVSLRQQSPTPVMQPRRVGKPPNVLPEGHGRQIQIYIGVGIS